jgi:transcriptional regulator with XRE-family HTH domain
MSSNMVGGDVRIRKANRAQGAWIGYQLKLAGVTQASIGERVKVSRVMVNRVIHGAASSARVQKAIAKALGFSTWNELLAAREGRVAA